MITPIEVSSKTFNKSGLGYEKKDVDNFMKEVITGFEALYKENVELKDKVNVLNEGLQYYKTIEKTIQKALVLAEQTAEETKETARQNAKVIEDQAKVKASLMLEDAKKQLQEVHMKTIHMIEQYEMYKAQYKNLAKAQVDLLESDSFQIHVANLEAFVKLEEAQETVMNYTEDNEQEDYEHTKESHSVDVNDVLPIENI